MYSRVCAFRAGYTLGFAPLSSCNYYYQIHLPKLDVRAVEFTERKKRGSRLRQNMTLSLDDVVISAVDKVGSDSSADHLDMMSSSERQTFDEGPVSAAPSSVFVAGSQLLSGAEWYFYRQLA